MKTISSPNGLNVLAIAPSRGIKYSPNLYRWLTYRPRTHRAGNALVFSDFEQRLWIGEFDDGCFIGSGLVGVLVNGEREASGAYYRQQFTESLVEVPDFWKRYMAVGRCAIDTGHIMCFIGDEGRWSVEGDTRHCLWCNDVTQTLRRWTERVERQAWGSPKPVALAGSK